jgi:hypothetical protein
MTTLRLNFKGVVLSRSDVTGMLNVAGDAVLVERGRPRLLVLMCPCGCGEIYSTNLDGQAGKAWRLYRKAGSITIYPSIWRDTGCESHFIIFKSKIFLFERWGSDDDDWLWANEDTPDYDDVLKAMSHETLESAVTIADRIDALPWDVLNVCRRLVKDGVAVEGTKNQRGNFRRK